MWWGEKGKELYNNQLHNTLRDQEKGQDRMWDSDVDRLAEGRTFCQFAWLTQTSQGSHFLKTEPKADIENIDIQYTLKLT